MERPVARLNCVNTSGFSASPAVVAWCTDEKSYFEMSSFMSMRYIVGGAQKVVMPYFANIGRICSAWKRAKS